MCSIGSHDGRWRSRSSGAQWLLQFGDSACRPICCCKMLPTVCSFFRSLASKDVWLCKQNMLLLKDTQGNIEYNYQNCLLFKVLQSYWRKLLLHWKSFKTKALHGFASSRPDAISRSSCSFIITIRIRNIPTSSFPTGLSGVMNHLPEASICAQVSVNTYHADW